MKMSVRVTPKKLQSIIEKGAYTSRNEDGRYSVLIPFEASSDPYLSVFHSKGGEILLEGEGYYGMTYKDVKEMLKTDAVPFVQTREQNNFFTAQVTGEIPANLKEVAKEYGYKTVGQLLAGNFFIVKKESYYYVAYLMGKTLFLSSSEGCQEEAENSAYRFNQWPMDKRDMTPQHKVYN